MKSCWRKIPSDRPQFEKIIKEISRISEHYEQKSNNQIDVTELRTISHELNESTASQLEARLEDLPIFNRSNRTNDAPFSNEHPSEMPFIQTAPFFFNWPQFGPMNDFNANEIPPSGLSFTNQTEDSRSPLHFDENYQFGHPIEMRDISTTSPLLRQSLSGTMNGSYTDDVPPEL